jgi:integrase
MARQKQQKLTQRKDGRYKAVYRGIQFMGRSPDEVMKKRQAYIEAEIRGDLLNRDGITVYSYALEWLPVHKASVSKNTYNAYVNYMNKLVLKIGSLPMKNVTPTDIKAVYNDFLGMSDSSVRKARMLYVDLWDTAIEDGIVKSNPCRSKAARPHKGTVGTHRVLTPEEDRMIISCPAEFRLGALLMRYAGLRRGEVMAFDVDRDVDFGNGNIRISRADHFEGNKGVSGSPKTQAGFRSIPLLDLLRIELQGQHGSVCPLKKTATVTSSAWRHIWSKYIRDLEQYSGMKITIRPHDLRHSYATTLRDAGVDPKLAIRWMGHADEKMILRIYDHPGESRVQQAVRSLNSAVKGAGQGAVSDHTAGE